MAFTRAELYADVSTWLKEKSLVVGAAGIAARVSEIEKGCAEFLLGMNEWTFASRVEQLQLAPSQADLIGWTYRYALGSVLKVNWVSMTGRRRDRMRDGWVNREGFILTDASPLYREGVMAEYANEAKYGYWPRAFGKAVASHIADQLQGAVVNSATHQQQLSARTMGLFEEACLQDRDNTSEQPRPTGSWLRSRRGGRRANR
jgi:hypothetical protein